MKYLVRAAGVVYITAGGTLEALEETELTATLFESYGVDELPTWALLAELGDVEILAWNPDKLPIMTTTMTAIPKPQIIISDAIDLSETTITGVEYVSTEYEGNPLYACSFDGGESWQAHNGTEWIEITSETGGMSAEALTSIGVDQWTEVITGLESFVMRFTLSAPEDKVTNIVVHYTN